MPEFEPSRKNNLFYYPLQKMVGKNDGYTIIIGFFTTLHIPGKLRLFDFHPPNKNNPTNQHLKQVGGGVKLEAMNLDPKWPQPSTRPRFIQSKHYQYQIYHQQLGSHLEASVGLLGLHWHIQLLLYASSHLAGNHGKSQPWTFFGLGEFIFIPFLKGEIVLIGYLTI